MVVVRPPKRDRIGRPVVMAMSKEEFLCLITPDIRDFVVDCVRGGIADYDDPQNYGPAARRDHTKSVRAQIRNTHIQARAARGLVEHPDIGVRAAIRHQRVLFIVRDKARISFKKLDSRLRPRNYPTRQALAYLGQRLPNFDVPDEATNLVVGYVPNAAETDFEVFVTCPQDEDNEWQLRLSGSNVVQFLDPAASGVDERSLALVPRKRRVSVRPDVVEKSDGHGTQTSGA